MSRLSRLIWGLGGLATSGKWGEVLNMLKVLIIFYFVKVAAIWFERWGSWWEGRVV
jgi:hypothetical protein